MKNQFMVVSVALFIIASLVTDGDCFSGPVHGKVLICIKKRIILVVSPSSRLLQYSVWCLHRPQKWCGVFLGCIYFSSLFNDKNTQPPFYAVVCGPYLSETNFQQQTSKHIFKKISIFIFSKLASGRNHPNPAIWLVPRAGSFLRSCPLTRAESLAASFTSLFVVCEWAKPVIFNHFSFKTCAIINVN